MQRCKKQVYGRFVGSSKTGFHTCNGELVPQYYTSGGKLYEQLVCKKCEDYTLDPVEIKNSPEKVVELFSGI